MPDPASHLEDPVDRYVRSELTPAEARELAQQSLDDPALFDELTFAALANRTLAESASGQFAASVRFLSNFKLWAAVAAAGIVLVAAYSLFPVRHGSLPSARVQQPTLAFSDSGVRPVLLASELQPVSAIREGKPVFRGTESDSRSPRQSGTVVSIDEGVAAIDLGSLDGLAKGVELDIFRGQVVGRVVLTTVFRERARGRIVSSDNIRRGDSVRVPDAVFLSALMERVDAMSGRGDLGAARTTAEDAARLTEAGRVPPAAANRALTRLAALEYHAGSLEAAERHYRSAADSLTESPLAWNNLAALMMLRGNSAGAEAALTHALSVSPNPGMEYIRSLNNLGVLAEMRGDPRKAEAYYADALGGFAATADSPAEERRAVEGNLARVKGAH